MNHITDPAPKKINDLLNLSFLRLCRFKLINMPAKQIAATSIRTIFAYIIKDGSPL